MDTVLARLLLTVGYDAVLRVAVSVAGRVWHSRITGWITK